jgi:hypothetical protein
MLLEQHEDNKTFSQFNNKLAITCIFQLSGMLRTCVLAPVSQMLTAISDVKTLAQ